MGPEPDPGVGPEVAHDPAFAELTVDARIVGCAHEHRAAASYGISRAAELEPARVEQVDEQLRQDERALANAADADFFDHVVARGRGVQRGHVRRAGEEAPRALRVLELGLEGKRARVPLPADERRLEPLGEIGAHVQPPGAGAAAQPLHAAADREVDVELGDVERHDACRLVAIEHDVGADLVRAPDDRLDVLNLPVLEEDVRDRNEQRALVDGLDDRGVVRHRNDLELGLRLVEVAHRREVRFLVDDSAARARLPEAR